MAEVLVKVCGITRLEDALAAQRAGADMLGFVFAPSPRSIRPEQAAEICAALSCLKVGVFVNESPQRIERTARLCGLDFVQLHGEETQADCDVLSLPVIKALRVRDQRDLDRAGRFAVYRLLFDTFDPQARGGTGLTFDWELLHGFERPYILAGGLGPENVAQAVARLGPWGVDASSRLESRPGIKDHARLAAFVAAAKGASDVTR